MKYVILIFFLFSSFLFFVFLLRRMFFSEQRLEKRMKKYLAVSEKNLNKNQFNLLLQFQLTKQKIRKNVLTKEKNNKLETLLARAGLPLKPEEYILFQWISTGFIGCLLWLISGEVIFLLIGSYLGFLFPKWYLRKKQKQRITKFNDDLPDMITTIVGSLRAGFSFPQALKAVTEEASSPIKDEMEAVLKEMQYGSSIEDSLNDLKERMPSEDLDLMIQAILIQRQVGGNLATVLDKIVETIRDRTKIHRQISTLTAQGRLSGIVIGLLPIILAFVLFLIEPDYIGTLFQNPIGIGLLIAGAISGLIGFMLIRKITSIEV
ncbi:MULTISPECIES: type II secretion system F family protein [unclassified Bacillus (in: firmicutes)]|uniref:type II secretion system F family protein n=1 Tax=unclassified Bacillus (in: firmicutes) TaxID=185979 RepID=UPI0008DEB0A8|nr:MULTISPECIES: type II secretion system F family protein [unclassified Bacillus (in: firmicutes)]SFA79311.1 tight adherence protein B [Bacillus sp. UNCCL13]SFQ69297.1 tight adherence protein B [Bacillus sp. cl95]